MLVFNKNLKKILSRTNHFFSVVGWKLKDSRLKKRRAKRQKEITMKTNLNKLCYSICLFKKSFSHFKTSDILGWTENYSSWHLPNISLYLAGDIIDISLRNLLKTFINLRIYRLGSIFLVKLLGKDFNHSLQEIKKYLES